MLGGSLEENILCALAWNDTLAPHIAIGIKSSDFSVLVYRRIASAALDFLQQHRRPAKHHIRDILEHDIRRGPDGKFMSDILEQMQRLAPSLNEDYVRNTFDRFLETQRLSNAVNDAADLLRDGNLEEAREVLRAPELLPKDSPGVWLRDSEQWFRWLKDEEDTELFSSGIDILDEKNVRPARGELMMLLAASGMGKSWYLIQVAKHNVLGMRRNVLHISLENSLDVTLQRYTQAFLALTRDEARFLDVGIFRQPGSDDATWIPHIGPQEFESIKTLDRDALAERLKPYQSRGALLVKHWPTGSLTMAMLNSYLDALEHTESFKPDIVVLDYLTLMHLDTSRQDLRIAIGQLARQVRGLAALRDCAVVTVLQANREARNKMWVTAAHTGEDWSLVGTADVFITYSQTLHERELRVARILVDKARNSTDKWTAFITQAYEIGQFCLDSAYMTGALQDQLDERTPDE